MKVQKDYNIEKHKRIFEFLKELSEKQSEYQEKEFSEHTKIDHNALYTESK